MVDSVLPNLNRLTLGTDAGKRFNNGKLIPIIDEIGEFAYNALLQKAARYGFMRIKMLSVPNVHGTVFRVRFDLKAKNDRSLEVDFDESEFQNLKQLIKEPPFFAEWKGGFGPESRQLPKEFEVRVRDEANPVIRRVLNEAQFFEQRLANDAAIRRANAEARRAEQRRTYSIPQTHERQEHAQQAQRDAQRDARREAIVERLEHDEPVDDDDATWWSDTFHESIQVAIDRIKIKHEEARYQELLARLPVSSDARKVKLEYDAMRPVMMAILSAVEQLVDMVLKHYRDQGVHPVEGAARETLKLRVVLRLPPPINETELYVRTQPALAKGVLGGRRADASVRDDAAIVWSLTFEDERIRGGVNKGMRDAGYADPKGRAQKLVRDPNSLKAALNGIWEVMTDEERAESATWTLQRPTAEQVDATTEQVHANDANDANDAVDAQSDDASDDASDAESDAESDADDASDDETEDESEDSDDSFIVDDGDLGDSDYVPSDVSDE